MPGETRLASYELVFELASVLWDCQNSLKPEDLIVSESPCKKWG